MNEKRMLSKVEIETLNEALKLFFDKLSEAFSPELKKVMWEGIKKSMENTKNHLDWMDHKILESLE